MDMTVDQRQVRDNRVFLTMKSDHLFRQYYGQSISSQGGDGGGGQGSMSRVKANPNMFKWAREKAGYSLDEASRMLGFRDSKRGKASDKLAAFEAGTVNPTRPQFERLASIYRRPSALFFMNQPPKPDPVLKDYRQLTDSDVSPAEAGMLNALQRMIRNRVDLLAELAREDDSFDVPALFNSFEIHDEVDRASASICEFLSFNAWDAKSRGGSSADFFSRLRRKAEDAGIYVFLVKRLGIGQPDIGVHVFRGFAIANELAPSVIVNGNDVSGAQVFTLVHELVHIAIGESAISGGQSLRRGAEDATERFCNSVAATVLLPGDIANAAHVEDLEDLRKFAAHWKVTPAMAAYRLFNFQKIDRELLEEAAKPKRTVVGPKKTTPSGASGPSAHVQWGSWLGRAAVSAIGSALDEGRISYTDAAQAFGMKPTSVRGFLNHIKEKRGGY